MRKTGPARLMAIRDDSTETKTEDVPTPKSGHIRVELIEELSDVPLSPDEWNALVARNETNTVFQTFQWFSAWWRTFGVRHRLVLLVLRADHGIIGFAPLMLRRGALGLVRLEFAGTGNSDYLDFVLPYEKPMALEAVYRFLLTRLRTWHRIRLCNIPEASSTIDILTAIAHKLDGRVTEDAHVPCPALTLVDDSGWSQEIIEKYSIRRPLNWFQRQGEVVFRHLRSWEEIAAMLPQFMDQHVMRWRSQDMPSLFEQPQNREFYMLLAEELFPSGWLLFSVLELDGRPIAFHFGFEYEDVVVWYKPSFDFGYAVHSPGLLLTRQLIEDAVLRAKREVDFTIGAEAFKYRFANHERFTKSVSVYRSRALGSLVGWLAGARRRVGALRRWKIRGNGKLPYRRSPNGAEA